MVWPRVSDALFGGRWDDPLPPATPSPPSNLHLLLLSAPCQGTLRDLRSHPRSARAPQTPRDPEPAGWQTTVQSTPRQGNPAVQPALSGTHRVPAVARSAPSQPQPSAVDEPSHSRAPTCGEAGAGAVRAPRALARAPHRGASALVLRWRRCSCRWLPGSLADALADWLAAR